MLCSSMLWDPIYNLYFFVIIACSSYIVCGKYGEYCTYIVNILKLTILIVKLII
jgi:hypothetical protein